MRYRTSLSTRQATMGPAQLQADGRCAPTVSRAMAMARLVRRRRVINPSSHIALSWKAANSVWTELISSSARSWRTCTDHGFDRRGTHRQQTARATFPQPFVVRYGPGMPGDVRSLAHADDAPKPAVVRTGLCATLRRHREEWPLFQTAHHPGMRSDAMTAYAAPSRRDTGNISGRSSNNGDGSSD
jgi:hypothetical protein